MSVTEEKPVYSEQFLKQYPELGITAGFKFAPEDFVVIEEIPFELTGEGEHVWLQIEKTDSNTDWVAQQLALCAGIKPGLVSYAGLKDRFAVTTQWFSLPYPVKSNPDFSGLPDEIVIKQNLRHQKKLQRGALKKNHFKIILRELSRSDELDQRCDLIAQQGVPNYFGEQRFGRERDNLFQAERMFSKRSKKLGKHKRGLYLSAARSWLFNCILSERIRRGQWQEYLSGDVFMLEGSSACFADDQSPDLQHRLSAGEIHTTSVLWGDGETMTKDQSKALEDSILEACPELAHGLVKARVEQHRRANRVIPEGMRFSWLENSLVLEFALPAGSYATSILRELVELNEPNHARIRSLE